MEPGPRAHSSVTGGQRPLSPRSLPFLRPTGRQRWPSSCGEVSGSGPSPGSGHLALEEGGAETDRERIHPQRQEPDRWLAGLVGRGAASQWCGKRPPQGTRLEAGAQVVAPLRGAVLRAPDLPWLRFPIARELRMCVGRNHIPTSGHLLLTWASAVLSDIPSQHAAAPAGHAVTRGNSICAVMCPVHSAWHGGSPPSSLGG